MKRSCPALPGRRVVLRVAACAFLGMLPLSGGAGEDALRIGIIGTGRIGGTLAELWARAGHRLVISSRHPEQLEALALRLGPDVRVGTPQEAAAFGDVLLVAVPYGALPQVGRDLASLIDGKVVLETGNPFPGRDGEMAARAREKGTGLASAGYLPGARLVRAFTSIPYQSLRSEAHRDGERVGVPLASDDAGALETARRLVIDAGFEPVVVGPLARAREFDVGSAVFGRAVDAGALRKALRP